MTDQELVEGCIANNAKAQRILFDKYAGKMMGICLRYMKNREEAQDILQEGFIKVFQKIGQYKNTGPLGGWIRMVMINTALIQLRKNKKWENTIDVSTSYDLSNDDYTIIDKLSADELMSIINGIPEGYRTVFNLFVIEGYPHKEIAEMLNITESTSKTQFRKARLYLKKILEENGE